MGAWNCEPRTITPGKFHNNLSGFEAPSYVAKTLG